MLITDAVAETAANHLTRHDPRLASVIATTQRCTIRPHKNYYQELVDSIISQQLSVKAARAIENRFRDMFGGSFPNPEQILTKDVEQLRAIGFSRAKATYVRDLAQHILDGRVLFDHFDELSNEEIVAELTAVKGIGEWTAHMFLMFCMGRSDVLPVGDLGIKNAVRTLYGLDSSPNAYDIHHISVKNKWAPYQSIAAWYLWQSLDNTPVTL